ncbi:MAG TPA: methyltransferase domain-containing protein [Actinocrinis sp.]|nr:methyltransferase domain-containing protein [Actinocrinis sp.]
MAEDVRFGDWDWQDPDRLAARLDEFTGEVARCRSLEVAAETVPSGRAGLAALGVTGIEFAAFRTEHAAGLGTDLVGVKAEGRETEPGKVYRVDGRSLFTQLDIGKPLPFDDGCVDWVYAEHLIEHVPLLTAISWLAEARRILAPGGVLRITTPDLRKYVEGYLGESGFFAKHRRRLRLMRVGPPMPERKAFMVNQIFYLYGHRWIYDYDELCYALTEAGFAPDRIRRCEYREGSRADVAELDTSFRNDETIYLEATA